MVAPPEKMKKRTIKALKTYKNALDFLVCLLQTD
jgi:hypothetical protein